MLAISSNVVQKTSLRKSMPASSRSFAQSSRLAILSFGLASCTSERLSSPDLDEPVFGGTHPTVFYVSPVGGALHVRDLAVVANTIRAYQDLDLAERALVSSAVARRLNALISMQLHQLTYENRARRDAIWKSADRATATRRLAAYDAELRRQAEGQVLRELGALLAVPLKTSDYRSAVAFARLGKSGVEVNEHSAEIDEPLADLVEGNGVRTKAGEIATLLGAAPVALKRPQPRKTHPYE